jgi:hypothetical protein
MPLASLESEREIRGNGSSRVTIKEALSTGIVEGSPGRDDARVLYDCRYQLDCLDVSSHYERGQIQDSGMYRHVTTSCLCTLGHRLRCFCERKNRPFYCECRSGRVWKWSIKTHE